jgi:hypothetical protein
LVLNLSLANQAVLTHRLEKLRLDNAFSLIEGQPPTHPQKTRMSGAPGVGRQSLHTKTIGFPCRSDAVTSSSISARKLSSSNDF